MSEVGSYIIKAEYYDKNLVRIFAMDVITFSYEDAVYKSRIGYFDFQKLDETTFKASVRVYLDNNHQGNNGIWIGNDIYHEDTGVDQVVRCVLPVYKDGLESYIEYRNLREDYDQFMKDYDRLERL